MANIQGADGATILSVEAVGKAARTVIVPRGAGHNLSTLTGTMAAALVADSTVFAMRLDPSASVRAFIDCIVLQWTTIAAFTVPITAARRLALFRGAGAAAGGGTAIATVTQKHSAQSTSEFNATNGGDARIATTAGLTVAGITYDATAIGQQSLSHVGAAGGYLEKVFQFDSARHELVLEPGQLLAIKNPVAMDAGGTWQLAIDVHWREAALLSANG